MGYKERKALIQELQTERKSKIVTSINSDRRILENFALPGLNTKLGTEAQPFFYKSLQTIEKNEKIDLFLYTSGGQTDSVWPMISIFREFSKYLSVLVPYKAHSAGTLICLGADELFLCEASELSPVDPSTGNAFNPIDEITKIRNAISVEEVTSYFELAGNPSKSKNHNKENNSTEDKGVDIDLAFKLLTEKVHPLALGNVNRSYNQIRELAKRLLTLHVNKQESDKIENIVNTLTKGRYSHSDILNRHEVEELLGKDIVKFSNVKEQKMMWSLFSEYSKTMNLETPFLLKNYIGDNFEIDLPIYGAFIETEKSSIVFKSLCHITQKSEIPPNIQVQIQPGQRLPLLPEFPRSFNVDMRECGWVENSEGV